jgi:putative restriction endonuclease
MPSRNWSREELIVAFNLYCKIPFGKIHVRNPEIIALAKALRRTPSSLSWKLANFARLDPELQKRNIAGATHGSKLDVMVWEEFNHNWEKLSFESERLRASFTGEDIETVAHIHEQEMPRQGKEREAMVKVRVNQKFFRSTVLAAYNFKCCITGLAITELLNASHIVPWVADQDNRVNPRNGLSLNAIHDRAFDRGLLTVTPDYEVKVSESVKSLPTTESLINFLLKYEGVRIALPHRFLPDKRLLEYHNDTIFK